jgi:serine/threonine-protein kinase
MKQCPQCQRTYEDGDSFCVFDRSMLVPATTADPLLGQVLGSYRIEAFLAEGGLGVVYRATHVEIKRPAAVKLIKREFLAEPTAVARFLQEARAVANIRHPNLIDIFDIGSTQDGRAYYVMELLEGQSLAARMGQGRLPWSELSSLMLEALGAIEAAHAAGIVHRDLKPDNLFIVERPGERFLKVLDFGVAKVLGMGEDVQQRLTRTGMLVGTPQYMAPEQIEGGTVDQAADVYALGVILYELATGALPFRAKTVGGMLKAHMLETPPRFDSSRMLDGMPAGLEAVVFRALAKSPTDRYASAHELREDLERLQRGQEPLAARSRQTAPTLVTAPKLPGTPEPQILTTPLPQPTTPLSQPTAPMKTAADPVTQQQPQSAPPPKRGRAPLWIGGGLVLAAGAAVVAWMYKPASTPAPPPTPTVQAPPPSAPKETIDTATLRSRALAVITEALKDGDPAIRRAAADALAQSRDGRLRTMLEPLLGDADLQVRAASASALSTLGARASVPALREAMGRGASVNLAAAEALFKLGDREVQKPLHELMKKGDEHSRQRAALILCDSDKEARKLVEKRAAKLPHGDPMRFSLLGQLGREDSKARDLLAEEMDGTGSPVLQIAASESLARLEDPRGSARLAQLVQSPDAVVKLRAYRALANLDDQSGYEVFVSAFGDAARPSGERVMAAQGLGSSGEKSALKTLAPALDDSAAAVRLASAGAVLQILASDPKALAQSSLDWATAAINDSSWEVREQAANVLADADAEVAVPLLGKALKDTAPEVRRTVVASLGRTKAPAAVPLLGQALDDQKEEVRLGALHSMGKIGDRRATPFLTRHLTRASRSEKVVAAGQLAKLGDRSHLSDVKEALKAPDPKLRKLAVEEAAADPATHAEATSVALKDSSFDVRFAAAAQLADEGKRDGVATLQEAVKKGGADGLRAWAALKKLGVEPKVALDPRVLLDSKDREVRGKAIEAAVQLPPGPALEFFRRALADADAGVRQKALESAALRASEPAILTLIKHALNDEDPAVRAKAAALVSKLVHIDNTATVTATSTETPAEAAPTPTPTPEPVAVVMPDLAPSATAEEASKEEGQLAMTAGEIALKSGRIDQAVKELTRAHRLDPKLPVQFSLGEAYRKLGDRETDKGKQRDAYEKAISFYGKARDKRAASYAAELSERLKEK